MAALAAESFLRDRLEGLAPVAQALPFEEDDADGAVVIGWRQIGTPRDLSATGAIRCLTDLEYEVAAYTVGKTLSVVKDAGLAIDAALTGVSGHETPYGLVRFCRRTSELSRPYTDRAGRTMQRMGVRVKIRVGR